MCEFLYRVSDKVNAADPYADARCTKAGDVITVAPDRWVWGVQEQLDPQYRILKVPGVATDDVASLLEPEPETDPEHPSSVLQARMFRLDLAGISPQLDAWLANDKLSRKKSFTLNLSLAALLALRVRKPALADPNVL